jgi:amino acid transporter
MKEEPPVIISSDHLVPEIVKPSLRRNALGLNHAIVMSVAVMSPTASIFFNTIPQAGLVGAAIPFCYVVGFIVALLMASQYSEMSRELPSSGSAYTFVSVGIGPRWGFMTGWIGLIAVALGVPYSFILMSANLQTLLTRWFGFNLHWSFWFVLAIGITFAICSYGIRQSLTIDLTFLVFEIGICLILAAIVLVSLGHQGSLSAEPFTTNLLPKNADLTTGIVLAVLSFIGFETAATLGEETRDPHRNIPRAVFGSMILVGIFYILMAYVATVGYGIDKMVTGYSNDAAPFDTISRHFGNGIFAAIVDLAGTISFFSAAIAIVNGGARIIYTVGRDGLLPHWIAWMHPQRHTPVGGIATLCVIGLVSGLALGFVLTPIVAFGFLGTLDALFVILIYALVNFACFRYFWTRHRERFNLLLHGIFPLLSTLIVLAIFLAALLSPGPAPLNLIPAIIGIWLVLGAILLALLWKKIPSEVGK